MSERTEKHEFTMDGDGKCDDPDMITHYGITFDMAMRQLDKANQIALLTTLLAQCIHRHSDSEEERQVMFDLVGHETSVRLTEILEATDGE